jgi:hypothetical protein
MTARTPQAAAEPSPLAAGLLALALLLQFVSSTWLWALMADSGLIAAKANYRAVWASSGFRGLPIEPIATGLNQKLPVATPIRLGPVLAANGQWMQRLEEGLYPRRIEASATITLELVRGASKDPVVAQTGQGALVLQGKLPAPPAAPVPGTFDFGLSWTRVLVHLFAAMGWGLALVVLLARGWRGPPAIPLGPAAALAAPVVYGVLGTVATIVQRPLPWTALTVTGLVLGLGALLLAFWRAAPREELRRRLAWLRCPESWAMVGFSALLVRHMVIWPIIGWDGRSIWLYRAKQVAYNGYLTIADAVNPANFFSHMEYPLLYPTWLAHFASSGPVREKELAVAAMALQLLLISTVWWLSRERLGRWVGAAFTGAVFILTASMSERGYADGFLTLFLLVMLFALEREELEPFGWLAAVGAALTKGEGLVFAGLAGGFFLLAHPRFRAKRFLPRFLPALPVALGAVPVLWARLIGIKNQYTGAKLPPTFELCIERLLKIWNGTAKVARESNAVSYLLAALGMYAVLEYLGRRSPLSRVMVATALGIVLFSFAVMMVTPYDVAGQVDTAMGRLLHHAVIALAAAVLVALTTSQPVARAGEPG